MKSKIWLDFDEVNNPYIRVRQSLFKNNDDNDLKDKFLNRLLVALNCKYSEEDGPQEELPMAYQTPNLPFGVGLLAIINSGSTHSTNEDVFEFEITPITPTKAGFDNSASKTKNYYLEYDFDNLYRKVKIYNKSNTDKVFFKAESAFCGEQIEASQILEYLEKGYNVSLGDYYFFKIPKGIYDPILMQEVVDSPNNDLRKKIINLETNGESNLTSSKIKLRNELLGENSAVEEHNEKPKSSHSKYDKDALEKIINIFVNNFVSSGIITIVEIGTEILDGVIAKLETQYNISPYNYSVVKKDGMCVLKKVEDHLVPSNVEDSNLRRTGRSTRLVDDYVQKLFAGEQVIVKDHNGKFSKGLFATIIERLKNEHGIWENSGRTKETANNEGYIYETCDSKNFILKLEKISK